MLLEHRAWLITHVLSVVSFYRRWRHSLVRPPTPTRTRSRARSSTSRCAHTLDMAHPHTLAATAAHCCLCMVVSDCLRLRWLCLVPAGGGARAVTGRPSARALHPSAPHPPGQGRHTSPQFQDSHTILPRGLEPDRNLRTVEGSLVSGPLEQLGDDKPFRKVVYLWLTRGPLCVCPRRRCSGTRRSPSRRRAATTRP